MKVSEIYPSKYFKAVDLGGDSFELAIRAVTKEAVGQGSEKEDRMVVYFRGEDRGLVLNKGNANALANEYGDDAEDWIGQSVTLYATPVLFGGKQVQGLRVGFPRPSRNSAAQRSAASKSGNGARQRSATYDEVRERSHQRPLERSIRSKSEDSEGDGDGSADDSLDY